MSTVRGRIVMCQGCEFNGDIPAGVSPVLNIPTTETSTEAGVLVLSDAEVRLSAHIVDSNNPSQVPDTEVVRELLAKCSDRNTKCKLAEAGYVPVEISEENKRVLVTQRLRDLAGTKLLGEPLILWES